MLYVVFGVLNIAMLQPMLEVIFNSVESEAVVAPTFKADPRYLVSLFEYELTSRMQENGKEGAISFVIVVLMGSVLLSNLFRYLANLIIAKVKVRLITRLRAAFYQSLMLQDLKFFNQQNRGDILTRGGSDIQMVENTVANTLKVLIKEPLMIIGLFITLYSFSPRLMLYSMLVLPFAGLFISTLARKLKRSSRKAAKSVGSLTSVLDETLFGMRVIKAFVAEELMRGKFIHNVGKYGKQVFSIAIKQNLAQPVSEIFGIASACIIIFLGSQLVFAGELKPETLLTFLLMFSQLLNPAKAFAGAFSNVQRGIASGERVFEIMDAGYDIRGGDKEVEKLNEGIDFKDVTFAYESKAVIKNISFSLSKGKILALVGRSGGGKSTIADLIPRFHDPTSGQITLDGHALPSYKTGALRNLIGVVTQESILFHDTIRANIEFGQSVNEDELIEAAKSANAHDFIMQLKDGYDTVIGDRGSRLSGGQRQRISIARALLANPPVLILDEATSALDSESEKLVQEAIFNLMKNRTTLVIAHRLSTVQHADEILVLDKGQIIQRGSHSDLMSEGGLYKKLTDMQSF